MNLYIKTFLHIINNYNKIKIEIFLILYLFIINVKCLKFIHHNN
jgi:hypothetical protein